MFAYIKFGWALMYMFKTYNNPVIGNESRHLEPNFASPHITLSSSSSSSSSTGRRSNWERLKSHLNYTSVIPLLRRLSDPPTATFNSRSDHWVRANFRNTSVGTVRCSVQGFRFDLAGAENNSFARARARFDDEVMN